MHENTESYKRYRTSPKFKRTRKRYHESEAYQEISRRYNHSKHGKSVRKKYRDLWYKTEKGRIYAMWQAAKLRAKRKRIVFSLAISDIHIPTICPLLDIPINLEKFGIRYDSPSLDRRNPRIGYTPENTWVISTRANILKNNATMIELETLTRNLKKCGYT